MKTVVFSLNDSKFDCVDFSDPTLGNPGVGGTEYLFVALAFELTERGIAKAVLVHQNFRNIYPKSLSTVIADESPAGLASVVAQIPNVDYLVLRGGSESASPGSIRVLPPEVPIIAWTHNHLPNSVLSYYAGSQRVKRVVYVGREQCALASGSPCFSKASYILNGFYEPSPGPDGDRRQRAVYVGSLVPQKGFHRLARLWPEIRRGCPDAELDVIGDGTLYRASEPLGPLGLASPSYEKLILHYLRGDPARFGVHFHGKLGLEKYDVIRQAAVGLPNPTGFTECCPGTVLEMSSCGAVVVAPRRWGMCDTVVDGITGYLCDDEGEYVARVIALLKDRSKAAEMGEAGREFVRRSFDFQDVCRQWKALFDSRNLSDRSGFTVPPITGSYPLTSLRRINQRAHSSTLNGALGLLDRVNGWFLKRR